MLGNTRFRLSVQGLGGWLLVYVVLTTCSMFMTLHWCMNEFRIMSNVPSVRLGTAIPLALACLWLVLYAAALCCLIHRIRGTVSFLKAMIAVTPVFHGLLPFIHMASLYLTGRQPEFMSLSMSLGFFVEDLYILMQYYPPQVLGKIAVSVVMAAVWFRYFSVSRSVAEYFRQEGRAEGEEA